MATRKVYVNDVLREEWNDDANPRTVTFYSESGAQTSQRAYTPAENIAADAIIAALNSGANRASVVANLNLDLIEMQTIIDTQNNQLTYSAAMMKTFARAIRRLDRMALGNFDSAN